MINSAAVLRTATTLVYCDGQQMDLYTPDHTRNPRPAVLYAHPGSWVIGDKSSGGYVDQLVPALTKRGFVVATINYRLGPRTHGPPRSRMSRAPSGSCGPTTRPTASTRSDRGLGCQRRRAAGEPGRHDGSSSRFRRRPVPRPVEPAAGRGRHVRSGRRPGVRGAAPRPNHSGHLGTDHGRRSRRATQSEPGHWATKDDPPFLILQGEQDQTVPPVESVAFAQRLRAAHVPTKLVMVRGAGHELTDRGQLPSRNDLLGMTIHFFQQHLAATSTTTTR